MIKIISLFQRNHGAGDRFVRNEVVPGAEWVIAGEGVATRKWDGTACAVIKGALYKRYDAKNGKRPPVLFIPSQEPDAVTGHWPGWVPVMDSHEDVWHREAWVNCPDLADGTYELVGPKVNGNPDGFDKHVLIHHGSTALSDAPRDFDNIKEYLRSAKIEGIVWHHPDGRLVKIKRKDFFHGGQKADF